MPPIHTYQQKLGTSGRITHKIGKDDINISVAEKYMYCTVRLFICGSAALAYEKA